MRQDDATRRGESRYPGQWSIPMLRPPNEIVRYDPRLLKKHMTTYETYTVKYAACIAAVVNPSYHVRL